MSFKEFMEMGLYYPELGYYNAKSSRIGPAGDFYTSPCLSSIFGTLIGKQLEEMWRKLGSRPFTVVEYGAGTGQLCHDILDHLKHNEELYSNLRYCIIERSPVMKEIEQSHLLEKVEWHNSIKTVHGLNGCVLSNELVDNGAVHQVIQGKELMEVFIDHNNKNFVEVLQPAPEGLKNYLKELQIDLPEGYRAEINLQATDWIKEAATVLQRGYVMTIDYGYLSAELYKPCKSCGTLVSYTRHTVNDGFYEHIGGQDITAHVNFSALIHWGAKSGLRELGFTAQGPFLLAMGFRECLQQEFSGETDVILAAQKASRLSHTLLIDMGSKFKILLQGKNVNNDRLSGFQLTKKQV